MRILILSHGHPDLSPGGGERAAYALFQRLKQTEGVTAYFVAQADQAAIGHDAVFGSFRGRPDEILAATPPVDGFTFQSLYHDALARMVAELIRTVKPDLVHVHHFIGWGIEIVELFQQAGIRVVFTLHEFAAICARYGQMLKTDGHLCHASSPAECGVCFPDISAGKFFVRRTIMQSLLSSVDCFIAPSHFLKERYGAWGLPPERVVTVENLLDRRLTEGSRPSHARGLQQHRPEGRNRKLVIGFFAQVNPFKGLDLLLEAAALLPEDVRRQVTIRIHGENRHYRDTDFARRVEALTGAAQDVVIFMGSYRGDDVVGLMRGCDWIVVPSLWWENSPLVIQEARLAERPLLGTDIGGIAEKTDAEVDRTFPAQSAGGLAEAISEIVRSGESPSRDRLTALAQARREADETSFASHYQIYTRLLDAPSDRSHATG